MDEGEAKKDGERWMFSQLVVISRFIKNPEQYPVFLLPWRKKYKKSIVKYLTLESDNVGFRHICILQES